MCSNYRSKKGGQCRNYNFFRPDYVCVCALYNWKKEKWNEEILTLCWHSESKWLLFVWLTDWCCWIVEWKPISQFKFNFYPFYCCCQFQSSSKGSTLAICSPNCVQIWKGRDRKMVFCRWDIKNVEPKARLFKHEFILVLLEVTFFLQVTLHENQVTLHEIQITLHKIKLMELKLH